MNKRLTTISLVLLCLSLAGCSSLLTPATPSSPDPENITFPPGFNDTGMTHQAAAAHVALLQNHSFTTVIRTKRGVPADPAGIKETRITRRVTDTAYHTTYQIPTGTTRFTLGNQSTAHPARTAAVYRTAACKYTRLNTTDGNGTLYHVESQSVLPQRTHIALPRPFRVLGPSAAMTFQTVTTRNGTDYVNYTITNASRRAVRLAFELPFKTVTTVEGHMLVAQETGIVRSFAITVTGTVNTQKLNGPRKQQFHYHLTFTDVNTTTVTQPAWTTTATTNTTPCA